MLSPLLDADTSEEDDSDERDESATRTEVEPLSEALEGLDERETRGVLDDRSLSAQQAVATLQGERRDVQAVIDRLQDRDDELAALEETVERSQEWAYTLKASRLPGPYPDVHRRPLQATYESLQAEGAATPRDLEAVYANAYSGGVSWYSASRFHCDLLPLLRDAPGVELVDAALYTVQGGQLGSSTLREHLEEISSRDPKRAALQQAYNAIVNAEVFTEERLYQAVKDGYENRDALRNDRRVGGMALPEALAAIPGVEPPEDPDAPVYRYSDVERDA